LIWLNARVDDAVDISWLGHHIIVEGSVVWHLTGIIGTFIKEDTSDERVLGSIGVNISLD